ncbi:helix-turn-helix domain-containing protein [Pseudoalteromonas umbrosa]|uniref:helix-turn-helix domain-containing protein n=1 Tax=Pseudoalteromonas umbrosa TaxID=3048489 RepID=UPI0024C25D75|nr:helix-turn-helix domain-containing protein [Pseudoalteromonas sp. B95]MDK1289422.1 helix-turn-helix domain-containing protein [Pseudoalteromonas sp. B95]
MLNNTPNLVQAVYMVSKHGLSISDIAESYQISKQALYRAVRAHNTSHTQQLSKLQKQKERLLQQLACLESDIEQLKKGC